MYKLNGVVLSLFWQHELMEPARLLDDAQGARFTLVQDLHSGAEVDTYFVLLM